MSHLYLMENDIKAGYRDGQVVIKGLKGGAERCLPFGSVDGISVFGMAQLSTQLIRRCISSNIAIGYYSADGHYYGRVSSYGHVDPFRQKAQVFLTENERFCVDWSRRVIDAKIRNSLTLLDCLRDHYDFTEEDLHGLLHSLDSLDQADSVDRAIGFEGNAARCYFKCLARVLEGSPFAFSGRSSRPPKDPFNSMLSYGYSLLYRNIIGSIDRHGLHAHFAFMHKIGPGHATLSSDLIEDYRAPLVDKTVIDMVLGGEVAASGFMVKESGAVYMTKGTMKALSNRLSEMFTTAKLMAFLPYGDRHSYGFQVMLDKKLDSVVSAIEQGDASFYRPFIWDPEFS